MKIFASVFPRRDWALLRFREGDPVESSHWTEGPQSRLSAPLEGTCVLWCCGSAKLLWSGKVSLGPNSGADPSLEVRPATPPATWDLGSPTLHSLNCSLRQHGQQHQLSQRFGFRSFRARSGRFELNGRPVFLRGNSVNPPGRYIDDSVGATYGFAYSYLRELKRHHINAVRIGDGVALQTAAWYDAADELGLLVYAGPYGNPVCSGCKAKPPAKPPPAGSAAKALARYKALLLATAPHPSHAILILGNEMDISSPAGHWGDAPYHAQYAALLREITAGLEAFDGERAYLGDAGFGEGLGGQIFDDHTYYGWYQGDPFAYYLHEPNPRDAPQPQTFTESVGNYLTAGGDFDVSGKNWAWSLKWTGPAQGAHEARRHASLIQRRSVEIVRRNRALNPHLAGIMPFGAPFYYCGKSVASFADLAGAPSPMLEAARTSFAPILLSLESWVPHAYANALLQLTVHVVNDADAGADLDPSTVSWALDCDARCPATARGTLAMPAVPYYAARSVPLTIRLPPAAWGADCDHATCTISASLATATAAAKPACVDAPGWTDVYGHGCDAFERDGHCKDGAFLPGHEWARGAQWGHPESNCCACNGKLGRPAATAETPPLLALAHPEPLTLFAPLPPEAAVAPLAVYDDAEGSTLAALRKTGLAVTGLGSVEALDAWPRAAPVVVGESLRGGVWGDGQLVRSLRSRLEAGGRVLLLEQSAATDWDDGVVRRLLDPALRVLPPTVTLPHSGRTLHRGEPVHPQRPEHVVFRSPHELNASWWQSWSLLEPWEPSAAQPSGGRRLPHPSPMSSALTLDVSSAAQEALAANAAALRRMAPLLTHAMGSAGLVLAEVFFPPTSPGAARGVALVCGLGLAARAGRDPVADRVLRNLAAYLRSAAPPVPHPLFVPGDAIDWGRNYSSERGVAYSAPSGLVVQPCTYSADCLEWPGGLGMPACGMLPGGPFDWTWMGHNRDLDPQGKTGWASVTFRSTASALTTRFEVTQWDDSPALPTAEVQLLGEDFTVAETTPCVTQWSDGAPEAACRLSLLGCSDDASWTNGHGKSCADYASEGWCAGGGAAPGAEWTLGVQFGRPEEHCCACGKVAAAAQGQAARHVTMRVVGPKTTALKRTVFV